MDKPECKYGATCYRKSKDHFQRFRHPEAGADVHKRERRTNEEESDDSPKRQKLDEEGREESRVSMHDGADHGTETLSDSEGACEDKEDSAGIAENPETPPGLDIRDELRLKFKVEMPQDFFDFWDYCKTANPSNPCDALQADLGLQLAGPYDVMAGNLKPVRGQRPNYVLHHRYFYDPPEFQTVVKGDDKVQHHLGYYRDEPKEVPVFVASNSAKEGCTLARQGENLFAAVKLHIEKLVRQTKDESRLKSLKKREETLTEWAKKCKHSLEPRTKAMREREKKVVTQTFHKAGIVVPVDSTGVGYRELPETDATLKKILKKIVESETEQEQERYSDRLQEIITLVQFANDECDYGQGYELGVDLFSYGHKHFHAMIGMLLSVAYQLLGREEFGEILEAHLNNRQSVNVGKVL